MLHALAMVGFAWMIYDFCAWVGRGFKPKVDKHNTFYDFGDTVNIAGVQFTRTSLNSYMDPTKTYFYARNLNDRDWYWTSPSISITQEQFFQAISQTSSIGSNSRTVSKKRMSK